MPCPHPPELRRRAIELARERAKPIAEIAADTGISEGYLHNWMQQADIDESRREGLTTDGHAEFVRLRRNVSVLKSVGEWSKRLLGVAPARAVMVHAFEPSERTYARVVDDLSADFAKQLVAVHPAPDHSGRANLYKIHKLAGSNSLHGVAGTTDGLIAKPVELIALDDCYTGAGIESIDLLKIDAEEHDLLALTGARRLLANHAVRVVQFDCDHRSIGARHYLRVVFELLAPLGYRIGKVTPRAIEWYPAWSPELETFREANFVAALPSWSTGFSILQWWNSRSGSHA